MQDHIILYVVCWMLSNINDFMSSVVVNIYNIRGINMSTCAYNTWMCYISNKISLDFSYTEIQ